MDGAGQFKAHDGRHAPESELATPTPEPEVLRAPSQGSLARHMRQSATDLSRARDTEDTRTGGSALSPSTGFRSVPGGTQLTLFRIFWRGGSTGAPEHWAKDPGTQSKISERERLPCIALHEFITTVLHLCISYMVEEGEVLITPLGMRRPSPTFFVRAMSKTSS